MNKNRTSLKRYLHHKREQKRTIQMQMNQNEGNRIIVFDVNATKDNFQSRYLPEIGTENVALTVFATVTLYTQILVPHKV